MGAVYYAPSIIEEDDFINYTVFLAGSIEMGKALQWQEMLCEEFSKIPNLTILNPRRKDWNSAWKQEIENAPFKEQVEWELNGIENSEIILFYFDPNTTSPITLAELGIVSQLIRLERRVIVCCPEGFYRKGNVDIIVERMKKTMRENPFFLKECEIDDYVLEVKDFDELKTRSFALLNKLANR